ncbi:unnamed protein product, partial [marine sediment metagenome]
MRTIEKGYKIVNVKGEKGIMCLTCNMISYNKNDIEHKYCG